MRFYMIEEDDFPGAPTLHVILEEPGHRDSEGQWWTEGGLIATVEGVWTREGLMAITGGADALERWDAADDEAYERRVQRQLIASEAEDIADGREN